jgi:hypothetical protein
MSTVKPPMTREEREAFAANMNCAPSHQQDIHARITRRITWLETMLSYTTSWQEELSSLKRMLAAKDST